MGLRDIRQTNVIASRGDVDDMPAGLAQRPNPAPPAPGWCPETLHYRSPGGSPTPRSARRAAPPTVRRLVVEPAHRKRHPTAAAISDRGGRLKNSTILIIGTPEPRGSIRHVLRPWGLSFCS